MVKSGAPLALVLAASVLAAGCLVVHPPCVIDPEQDFYRTVATTAIGSACEEEAGMQPLSTEAPLTIDETAPPPAWDLSLAEAVRLGLEHSKVLRDWGGSVLRTPMLAQTISDPAIQASDPRFGMEGALAAFDAQLSTSLFAYNNDRAFNNLFLGGGAFLFKQDLDNFVTELSKQTASGARFAVRHHIDYDANNATANVFPSYYNVNFETEFRQPLLQGAGVDFNRIAGPNGTPGLVHGVVIARINNDVSTAEFEQALRNYISNVENAYWDLYYAYRDLDAKIAARDTSLNTWRIIHANVEEGRGYSKLQEVQALEQYYRFQQDVLDALGGRVLERTRTYNGAPGGSFRGIGGVQAAERQLRMWMGMTINDGRLIRPTDEPPAARVTYDWGEVAAETLARRPELRRQQAVVKRYEAELVANRNFLLPRLDLVGLYRWRGYGHDLIGAWNPSTPYQNAFANLTSGQFQEWELGFQYSMPLGFRREYAAVRNAQFRIARERAILEEQERQAIHDLSDAVADVTRSYDVMQVAYNRLSAAQDQFRRANDAFFELGGKVSLELVLDARIRLADAETGYHRSRIEYAVALKNVQFEKGSLLEYSGATLADGESWCGAAADIARKKMSDGEMPQLNYAMATEQPPADQTTLQQPVREETSPAATGPAITDPETVVPASAVRSSAPAATPDSASSSAVAPAAGVSPGPPPSDVMQTVTDGDDSAARFLKPVEISDGKPGVPTLTENRLLPPVEVSDLQLHKPVEISDLAPPARTPSADNEASIATDGAGALLPAAPAAVPQTEPSSGQGAAAAK